MRIKSDCGNHSYRSRENLKDIVIVIPHAENGGMPRVAATLSNYLSDFYNISIVLLINNMDLNFQFSGVVYGLCPIGNSYLAKTFRVFERLYHLRKLLKTIKPKYIISFGSSANILAVLSKSNSCIILTEHNIKSVENRHLGAFAPIYSFLMRLTYRRANRIIALTQYMKKDLIKHFRVPETIISVLENPHSFSEIKLKAALPLSEKHKSLSDMKFIISVGNTSKIKAHQHVIRIMPDLLKSVDDFHLVILGSPAEQQHSLEELVIDLGIQSNVHFLGFQENPFNFMVHAKLLVHCSLHEGLPNVLIEAMALGIPVISSDCVSGPREILAPESFNNPDKLPNYPVFGEFGILCPDFRVPAPCQSGPLNDEEITLLQAVLKLLTDEPLRRDYINRSVKGAMRYDAAVIGERFKSEIENVGSLAH